MDSDPELPPVDAADVFRTGDQRPDRPWLDSIPFQAVHYQRGDRVLVWAVDSNRTEALLPGNVLHYDNSTVEAGFAVLLDPCEATDGKRRVTRYATGAPYLNAEKNTFSHAFRAGHCGALERRRILVRAYAVQPDPNEDGERSGWKGLLVGPGARVLGHYISEKLRLMPDADTSSTAVGDGEHYWLYLRAQTADQVHKTVNNQARSQLQDSEGPMALLGLLEKGQKLLLWSTARDAAEVRLLGSNAHAVAPMLRQALPEVTITKGATTCARVSCEQLVIRIPHLATFTDEPLEQRVRELLVGGEGTRDDEGILPQLNLPKSVLLPSDSVLDGFPRADSCWRLREEGPLARYAGEPPHEWREAYRCPANTLAVEGPRSQLACVLKYAIEQGAAPISVQAEELPPPHWRLSYATPARAAAAVWSGSGGLHGACAFKREQARGNYHGSWDIVDFEVANDASEAEREEIEEEQNLAEECLSAWIWRNVRNQLEGKLCLVPPSFVEIRVRLRPHCGPVVEYEDFRALSGDEEVFCIQGPVGAGRERLWNPAFPTPERPDGWIRSAAPECSANLLVLSLPGAAFPRAQSREAVEAEFNQTRLLQLEASPALRKKLHQGAFKAKRIHVFPTPLPDWRGREAVEGVTPVPFCPSLHPHFLKIASDAELQVRDLEDWGQCLSGGALPCSLCQRDEDPECQVRMNAIVPGLLTVRPSTRDRSVAVFPSGWHPRAARLVASTTLRREAREALTDNTPRQAIMPPLPANDLHTRLDEFTLTNEQQVALVGQLKTYRVTNEAASGVSSLARFFIQNNPIDDEVLRKAVPFARSPESLASLVDAAKRFLKRRGTEIPEATPLLTQLAALRSSSPAWPLHLVFRLAALVDSEADKKGLANLLEAVRAGGTDENALAVAQWLNDTASKDFVLEGLCRLRPIFRKRTSKAHVALVAEKRESFVKALSYRRETDPTASALCRRARFLLAARGPLQVLCPDRSAWGCESLNTWWQRTIGWEETQAANILTVASEANLAAHAVLSLLERHGSQEAFEPALKALREGRPVLPDQFHAINTSTPAAAISAQQRAGLQLIPPEAGEQRLHDAQEQPEHQALLLSHVLRELISTWAALATDDACLVINQDELPAVLRGDQEYLSAERQRRPALPRMGECGGLLDNACLRDILTRGSASMSEMTGGCVPRRVAWVESLHT